MQWPRSTDPGEARSWARASLLAVVVGVAVGALTFVGQRFMPGQWNTLVNSRRLARAGVLRRLSDALASVVCRGGRRSPPRDPGRLRRSVRRWPARRSPCSTSLSGRVSLVAGPLFGMAGCAWRSDRRRLRVVGVAMLGGVLAAEGLYLVIVLGYLWSGWSMVAAGVAAVVALSSRGDRLLTLAVSPLPIAPAGLVYAAISWLGTFNRL